MTKEIVVLRNEKVVARGEKEATITGLHYDTEYKKGTFQVGIEEDGVLSDLADVPAFKTEIKVVDVESISLSPKNSTAKTGAEGTRKLTATVSPEDATNQELEYSITPETDGLTVDETGLISWNADVAPGEYITTVKVKGSDIAEENTLTLEAPE